MRRGVTGYPVDVLSRRAIHALILITLAAPATAAAQQMTDVELQRQVELILELERRVSRHNDDPQLMLRLVDAYAQIGDLRRVLPGLERLSALGVDPIRIALLRGDAYLTVGEYDVAARSYLDALSRAPDQPHALTQLWRLMLRVNLEEAEVSLDREVVIDTLQRAGLYFPDVYEPTAEGPEEATRLLDRANSLLMRGRPEEATVWLTRAISLDPGNAPAFAALARAYRECNDDQAAVGASLVYLLLAPDAPDAPRVRRAIGRVYEQSNLR